MLVEDITSYQEPLFEGISHGLIGDYEKYNAIFVDEAQDFTEEWASIIRLLLDDPEGSRLGVFFDDVQVLREESFGNGFGIGELPYLLRENIRNTANIYNWTAEKTNLGTDMVANPVEGPTPTTEIVNEHGQLVLLFETLFKRYLEEEGLPKNIYTRAKGEADEAMYVHVSSTGEEIDIPIWDYVTLPECKQIILNGKNWSLFFEDTFVRPEEANLVGGKDPKTDWILRVNSISNKLSKESYSVPVDEYSYVKSIYDWLMGILVF